MPTNLADLIAKARDERLVALLNYLASDPGNIALRSDAADQALAAREPNIAAALFGQPDELDDRQLNLAGLAALELGDHPAAAASFALLRERGVDEPTVAFNLAWALAKDGKVDEALLLLTDEVVASGPGAATLKLQLLHGRGDLDEALEVARRALELNGDDRSLNAAVSVLAIDTDQAELAETSALKARSHPDAMTALGTLALRDSRPDEALALFDEALAGNDGIARAWIGRGLSRMMQQQPGEARGDLDRGAELFEDHSGSWVAAGWAHVMSGDYAAARERFERAVDADGEDNEGPGALAVVDMLEGNAEAAKDRLAAARALGGESISASLAEALIASGNGDPAAAKALMAKLLGGGEGMSDAALAKLTSH